MFKRVLYASLVFVAASPALTFAQNPSLTTAANNITGIIQILTTAAYMLAFLAFFWGLAMYQFKAGEDDKGKGIKLMITSIIVIFIMTSIWGIVKVLRGTLGANDNSVNDVQIPGIQFR